MNTKQLKGFIRQPYAWPGGYPLYLIMQDGEPLCNKCAKDNFRQIISASKYMNKSWVAYAVDVNWEDATLYCSHCGELIESAYGE